MKIKRFNENLRGDGKYAINFKMTEDVDHEYIKQCFIDFIDDGAHTQIDGNTFTMSIELPVNLSNSMTDFGFKSKDFEYIDDDNNMMRKYIESFNTNNEFYKEIGRCFDRLEMEYPDLRMKINPGDSSIYIMITRG